MSKGRKKKVFVGMSGGVDSSVAGALLKQQGHDVVGIHLKCYNVDGCGERDAEDARRVAEQLDIPFYVFDLEKEYKARVVEYMVDGYQKGLTPNPDVMCNKEIKFGLFLQRALELGADCVATGHYVRLRELSTDALPESASPISSGSERLKSRSGGRQRRHQAAGAPTNSFSAPVSNSHKKFFSLFVADDKNKDQSYFLWTLTQEQLRHCLFPIGEHTKPQVRRLAKKFGLLTADKKDSQGICFLGKVTLADFLKGYIPEKRGAVLNTAGQKIGEHRGAYFYTIGQRHGLGVGGLQQPHYVVAKDVKKNTITLAEGVNQELFTKEVFLQNIHFINPVNGQGSKIKVLARVRYRQPLVKALLRQMANGKWQIVFNEPQKFVAAGQSAVFYNQAKEMIGGGVIL